jgi:hypothetical protein
LQRGCGLSPSSSGLKSLGRRGARIPWAAIGQGVGQRDLAVTANTYTHVLTDERELDYPNLLA